ncbi:mitogen-activated protein kinase kinase 10 [Typha angustifolia]|uniref:mitogen-activated protein kinase kinase 10 n=1 Tax=Typha angustifolia TaxID=59011 RepID=UPI003C2E36FD
MAMVRERRHQQPLRLQLLPPSPGFSSSPRPSPSHVTADPLADLELLRVIGHGGGGTVHKVRHRRTCAVFALKLLHVGSAAAVLEADLLPRLSSPFVVRCHAVIAGDRRLGLLLEYMAGGSLLDVLRRRGRLPEALIAAVARHVLLGLEYLHDVGVVHGDIKPSNLLVSRHGEVKIADFGASRVVGKAPGGDTCGGTCAYMSPERLDSEGFGGARDDGALFAGDVWALGVVVMECHVGRHPLVGEGERPDLAALMCAVCLGDTQTKAAAATSPEMRSFVGRCLEKEWWRRGTVGELLGHPFVAIKGGCSTKGLVDEAQLV